MNAKLRWDPRRSLNRIWQLDLPRRFRNAAVVRSGRRQNLAGINLRNFGVTFTGWFRASGRGVVERAIRKIPRRSCCRRVLDRPDR